MTKKRPTPKPRRASTGIEEVHMRHAFQAQQHRQTSAVIAERDLVLFQIKQVDDEINELEGILRATKSRRRQLAGRERGLNAVLEVRGSTIVSA